MKLQAISHATMALWDNDGRPLLITDPWLVGSCYWRSWWLQHPPLEKEIEALGRAPFIYITHEHPDHLHPPSLRRLGAEAEILLPDFLALSMESHLGAMGFRTRRLPAGRWTSLSPGVSLMSLPTWANDSILLVDTPEALIVNLNDAKPSAKALARIGALGRALDKPTIALRSYSPASPFNSTFRKNKRIIAGPKKDYVRAAGRACDAVGANWFMPFASQVVFRRRDSRWANRFAVRFPDLESHWSARAKLLPPFTTIDLGTMETTAEDPESYRGDFGRRRKALVREAEKRDEAGKIEPVDHDRLRQTLAGIRLYLLWKFPKGVGFRLGAARLHYDPWRNRVREARDGGAFVIEAPIAAFKDALAVGHLGDLAIPMFTSVHLAPGTRRTAVNRFFMALVLRDYGYLGSPPKILRWAFWAWRLRQPSKLPRPD